MNRTLRALAIPLAALIPGVWTHAGAATLTVGPGGTHPTIQAAIDAAEVSAEADEIRVAGGTYHERLVIDPDSESSPEGGSGALALSGGWDATFTIPSDDPNLTVVDADHAGRVLLVRSRRSAIEVSTLILGDGRTDSTSEPVGGAGARLETEPDGRITLRNVAVIDCHVVKTAATPAEDFASGGGIYAFGSGVVEVLDSVVAANSVTYETGTAGGGGIAATMWETGHLGILRNQLRLNEARSGVFASAAGLHVLAEFGAEVEVSDNVIEANVSGSAIGSVSGLQMTSNGMPASRIEARRNRVIGNGGGVFQVAALAAFGSQLLISDTLAARGEAGGISLIARDGGILHANNLTVADNAAQGIAAEIRREGTLGLANSISFGNGEADSIPPEVALDTHLTSDPLFVDAAAGDYGLRMDSPAIDAGIVPSWGLGPLDLRGGPRVQGIAVDLGAYESEASSDGGGGSGGGPCRVRIHDPDPLPVPFVPDWAPVCRCLRDTGLAALRCGGLGPGVFPELLVPLPLVAGQPVQARWTLHPWSSDWSGEYRLQAALLVGQKVVPAAVKGKGGKLDRKDVHETIDLTLPFGPAILRTSLQVLVPGALEPVEVEMDVLLEPSAQDPVP